MSNDIQDSVQNHYEFLGVAKKRSLTQKNITDAVRRKNDSIRTTNRIEVDYRLNSGKEYRVLQEKYTKYVEKKML